MYTTLSLCMCFWFCVQLLWCVHSPSAQVVCTHIHTQHTLTLTCIVHIICTCTQKIQTYTNKKHTYTYHAQTLNIHTHHVQTLNIHTYTLVHTHLTPWTLNTCMHTLIQAYTYCYEQVHTYIRQTYVGSENAKQLLNVTFIKQTFYWYKPKRSL